MYNLLLGILKLALRIVIAWQGADANGNKDGKVQFSEFVKELDRLKEEANSATQTRT